MFFSKKMKKYPGAARKVLMRVKSGCDVDVRTRKSVPVASVARLQKKMPHRCVAGRCGNTAKDGFSLHSWPSNPSFVRLWTNAVRSTRANFTPTSASKLCSAHFPESSFEATPHKRSRKRMTARRIVRALPPRISHHLRHRLQNGPEVLTEKERLQGFV